MQQKTGRWNIWIDTGGTFTDCIGVDPDGEMYRTKVLSSSGLRGRIVDVISESKIHIEHDWKAPADFINDFSFELLEREVDSVKVKQFNATESVITLDGAIADDSWRNQSFEVSSQEESPVVATRLLTQTPAGEKLPLVNLRLATTLGTNALLERKGAPTALFITKGFGDLLEIGTQQRPDLFALNIQKPPPLYQEIVEIEERIDARGEVLTPLDLSTIETKLKRFLKGGIKSAAVVLMNSYRNPKHEQRLSAFLKEAGFEYVSVSSELSQFVKILPRAETTLVNAYLAPVLEDYINRIKEHFVEGRLSIITSAGGLINSADFNPKDGLLSGPAAGVVGAAAAAKEAGFNRIISFDMGGTSTDVSRYDEDFEYIFEHKVGDAHLMAPAVAVETVAAGGGSICSFNGHVLQVGPESAGASPGPACYGAGGPLTLTDINVLAGRLDKQNFHIPIDIEAAKEKFDTIVEKINNQEKSSVSPDVVLEGFLEIANQRMAKAIEKISLQKGYDPEKYGMISFGGAGGQHCCGIARRLGIKNIIIPGDAGLLSAYGLGHAVMEHFEEKQILKSWDDVSSKMPQMMERLAQKALKKLKGKTSQECEVRRKLLFMRLQGQESTLEISHKANQNVAQSFRDKYKKRYGHWVDDAVIEVESLRVVVSTQSNENHHKEVVQSFSTDWPVTSKREILFDGKKLKSRIYNRSDAEPGMRVKGPALILDSYSTLFVEPGWEVNVHKNGSMILYHNADAVNKRKTSRPETVELELFTHRFTSIAEKMGEMLQRTALSVNVKERLDFSCALLNSNGELVVNAPHIPVHLGALGICVRSLMNHINMEPGDVIITNHPAYGGSHLPDVTVVTPVFTFDNKLVGFAANRAHHAEIGGMRPGSMPPNATNLAQEGVVIPPMYLLKNGESRFDSIKDHLLNVEYPTRSIDENIADLQAQVAANQQGAVALRSLLEEHDFASVQHYMAELTNRAAQLMEETIQHIPNGIYKSRELLDDGSPLCAVIDVQDQSLHINFEGTGAVHPYNLNATPAIVSSVVMYVLRVLVNQPIPLNEGLMRPISLKLPEGCLLNPAFDDDPQQCPAVVGGNIEVSQRLVDTLLKPFKKIACGQGTMNNILFGNEKFGYYETVGGGTGAGPDFEGADAVHHHMTNTKGTDPEILEQRYPVQLDRYAIRRNSGGRGNHRGGNGIIREMTFLEPLQLSVLTEHRVQAPYGQEGGEPGSQGEQWIIRKNGEKKELASSDSSNLKAGDQFILHTPGGGGFGKSSK